jgi:hypothetical protein
MPEAKGTRKPQAQNFPAISSKGARWWTVEKSTGNFPQFSSRINILGNQYRMILRNVDPNRLATPRVKELCLNKQEVRKLFVKVCRISTIL